MNLIKTRCKFLRSFQWNGQPIDLTSKFSVQVTGMLEDQTPVGMITWNDLPLQTVISNQWVVIGPVSATGIAVFDDESYHANFLTCTVEEGQPTLDLEDSAVV